MAIMSKIGNEEREEEEAEENAEDDANSADLKHHSHPSLHRLDPRHVAEVQQRLKRTLAESEFSAELDLSSLDLYSVPLEVLRRPSLTRLAMRSNCLMDFPAELSSLTALTALDLSRNRIEVLPEAIGELRGLRDLNLMNNHLRRLERSIPLGALALLTSLERLDMRYNKKFLGANLEEVLTAHVPAGCQLLLGSPSEKLFTTPAERDATQLRSQLEPWGTPALHRRLQEEFGLEVDPDLGREGVFALLLEAYAARGPRTLRKVCGLPPPPCSAPLLSELLTELRKTDFPTGGKRERQGIQAQGYIVLRRSMVPSAAGDEDCGSCENDWETGGISASAMPGVNRVVQPGLRTLRPVPKGSSKKTWGRRKNEAKVLQHESAWNLAQQLMRSVDPDFAKRCSAIAFTKNFVGSPHIDIENWGPFYGLSLGDFDGGGVCVEAAPCEVVEVDTQNKFGRVDGRWPHWVAPYAGERYSVIYYQTEGPEVVKTTSWFRTEEYPFSNMLPCKSV